MLTNLMLQVTLIGAEWVLWLLMILSMVSIALIVDRALYFYRHRIDGEELAVKLEEKLRNGEVRAAWELVKDSDCIECRVVESGLSALRRGATACGEAMLATKARLKTVLDARMAMLATIGSNAPFIGLLGTVLGIVKAAHDMTGGGTGQGDPNAVMAGVFEALVATAVGLFVAIPAVIAFNIFQRYVRKTLAQTDSLAHLVLSNVRVESRPRAVAEAQQPVAVRS